MTRTENPFRERGRVEDRTRFSQAGPPQEWVRSDLRERSDGIEEDEDGDLKKKTKIKPKNTNDQKVSLAREEWSLSL